MDGVSNDAEKKGSPRIPKKKKIITAATAAAAGMEETTANDRVSSQENERKVGGEEASPEKAGRSPKNKSASPSRRSASQNNAGVSDPPILRKGDLVRLSNEQKSGRIQGGLARVIRSNFADDDAERTGEPISYDIEYVLGGKLSNVERFQLSHTTATAEGLVDAGDRNSRGHLLRRRQASAKAAEEDAPPTPSKTSAREPAKGRKKQKTTPSNNAADASDASSKRRGPGRPPGSCNKSKSRKSDWSTAPAAKKRRSSQQSDTDAETALEVRRQAAKAGWEKRRSQEAAADKSNRKSGSNPSAKSGGGKRGSSGGGRRNSQTDASESSDAADDSTDTDNKSRRLDMYVKHKRELEKSLSRLEKADRFGFFLENTPEEFDENYEDVNEGEVEEDGDDNESDDASSDPQVGRLTRKKMAVRQFPDQPPFNFLVIRKRLHAGRYDMDMVAVEMERLRQIRTLMNDAKKESGEDGVKEGMKDEDDSVEYDELAKSMCHPIAVDWDTFNNDVIAMCDAATIRDPDGAELGSGHLGWAASKVKKTMEEMYAIYGVKRRLEVEQSESQTKYKQILNNCGNMEAAMQGDWRKEAFPERKYERLETSSVICDGLSSKDRSYAMYELETKLPDSFVGLAYTYDDRGQHSESWMKTVVDETQAKPKRSRKKKKDTEDAEEQSLGSGSTKSETKAQKAAIALARDDGVVRAQVQTTMTHLLIQVQDKVMTDLGVMHAPEARSANWDDGDRGRDYRGGGAEVEQGTHSEFSLPEVAEQEVWGMDCYTRKNVMALIESEFSSDIAIDFVEKWLLPAINACPVDLAHKMSTAARLLEGLEPVPFGATKGKPPEIVRAESQEKLSQERSVFLRKAMESKVKEKGPPWLKAAARLVRLAADSLDDDYLRIHPKGHGSVVIGENGLKANSLVTYYRGEVYPAWRWCEKLDAIEHVQKKLDLRPNLPDFYNMAMERPKKDPRGYCLLFVDASRKSGLGSSFSHSCNPTCEVRVVSLNEKLSLSMTTLRDLEQGEELTFDYNAVTESLNEYQFAVCLCGQRKCRGSFLHFATADCYQQVLSRNSPISARFANLVRGCMKKVMSKEDSEILAKHGFNTAAFGAVSFNHHHSKYNPQSTPDSIENVPVWLRTYVADCLRYIEYERRALPVALLCNQMERMEKEQKKPAKSSAAKKAKPKPVEVISDKSKAIPGSKPKTSYFYYLDCRREHVAGKVQKEFPGLKGLELSQRINTECSQQWASLSEKQKQSWKKKAVADWKKNGGEAKAKLEKERQRALKKGQVVSKVIAEVEEEEVKENKPPANNHLQMEAKTISFADADAEGFSAMEQRIQQLAQSLSRVGRVLDRHRESVFDEKADFNTKVDSELLRSFISSPLKIMSEEEVVNWMWADPKGIVSSLFLTLEQHFPQESLLLRKMLSNTRNSYPVLGAFTTSYVAPCAAEKRFKHTCSGADARRLVHEALLKFRSNILDFLSFAEDKFVEARNEKRREQARQRDKKNKGETKSAASILSQLPGNETGNVKMECDVSEAGENKAGSTQSDNEETSATAPLNIENEVLPIRGGGNECTSTADENNGVLPVQGNHAQDSNAKIVTNSPVMFQAATSDDVRSLLQLSRAPTLNNSNPDQPFPFSVQAEDSSTTETMTQTPSRMQGLSNAIGSNDRPNEAENAALMSQKVVNGQLPTKETEAQLAAVNSSPLQPKKEKKKVVIPLTDEQVNYLKNWLLDPAHILNPYPTDEEKTLMMKDIGIERKRLDGWFMKNRQRALHPEIPSFNMKWRKIDQEHWVEFRKNRYMLEATADLLLIYANTNTFFMLEPFRQFDSTPIDVYARELGNEVPRHLALNKGRLPPEKVDSDGDIVLGQPIHQEAKADEKVKNSCLKAKDELCSPEDVIDQVTVDYTGDYVFSQLLQWVNGGIGQNRGLPNMYGCSMLPPIQGCWDEIKCGEVKLSGYTKWNRKTTTEYDGKIRPRLAGWFSDRYQRGNPWHEDIAEYFCPANQASADPTMPMGSPIMDYLVTGIDENIRHVSEALSGCSTTAKQGKSRMSTSDRLQSTVDEGMPAQAVANWVQCENPNCLKWRKLPWHVDVDLLPEKFFCKDNVWNPKCQSCDTPEDDWDMDDAPIKFDASATEEHNFEVGAWFDVQREGKVGYHEAQVAEIDFESDVKRVKFHFWRLSHDKDEWINMGSPRIAPHHSYTPRPLDGYREKNSEPSKAGTLPQKRKIDNADATAISSERVDGASNEKKTLPFKKSTIDYLNHWISQHASNPFPSLDEKERIMADTGMTKRQVGDWMARARKKLRNKSTQPPKSPAQGKVQTAVKRPSADVESVKSIKSSPTRVENLLLALASGNGTGLPEDFDKANQSTTINSVSNDGQSKTSIKELESFMKSWLSRPENKGNLMPSLEQKENIIKETGIDKKRLEGWFFRARKKLKRQQDSANGVDSKTTSHNPSRHSASVGTPLQQPLASVVFHDWDPPKSPVSNQMPTQGGTKANLGISTVARESATKATPLIKALPSSPSKLGKSKVPNHPTKAAPLANSEADKTDLTTIPNLKGGVSSQKIPASSLNTSAKGLTEEAKKYLQRWIENHQLNPYPSRDEKDKMMNYLDINNDKGAKMLEGWFCRARKKMKQTDNPKQDKKDSIGKKDFARVSVVDAPKREPDTAPSIAASSPFASLLSAAKSELGTSSHRTSPHLQHSQPSGSVASYYPAGGGHATHSGHYPQQEHARHGFTTHAATSDIISNLGAKEKEILSTFQSLKSMEIRDRPTQASAADHQFNYHQQGHLDLSSSYHQNQARQQADYGHHDADAAEYNSYYHHGQGQHQAPGQHPQSYPRNY